MDDDSTKRAAELLLNGAKMLNEACPTCKNPIYKLKDGNMRCPYCNKKVVLEDDEVDTSSNSSPEQSTQANDGGSSKVRSKIKEMEAKLDQTDDPDKIIKIAESIKKLKELL